MERSTKLEGSPDAKKSTVVGLRFEKQSEIQTDHLNYWHNHQKLRHLGGGWALRLRLWRLVHRSRLGFVVWRQHGGLGSSALWVEGAIC